MGRICGLVGDLAAHCTPKDLSGFLTGCHRQGPSPAPEDVIRTGPGYCVAVRGPRECHSEDGRYTCFLDASLAEAPALVEHLAAKGYPVEGRTRAEVFLDSFLRHGVLPWKHLRGSFAAAIYDARKQCLILAVDPYGLKHLYVGETAGGLVFASDLTGLARSGFIPLDIGEQGLLEYFSLGFVSPPWTIYGGITSLCVGEYLVREPSGTTREHYHQVIGKNWEFSDVSRLQERDLVDQLEKLLLEAVRVRLSGDGAPVATYLSGGLDTGMLAAVLQQIGGHQVTAFTLGSRNPRYDEIPRARKLARQFGVHDHNCVYLQEEDCFAALDDLAEVFGQPMADISAIPNLVITRAVAENFSQILAGDGPDGLYGNWDLRPWHYYYRFTPPFLRRPVAGIIDAIDRWAKLGLSTPTRSVFELLSQGEFSWVFHKKFKDRRLAALLGREVSATEFEVGRYLRDRTDIPLYERLRMGFAKYFVMHGVLLKSGVIHDALLVDQVCPYYDRDLVDFICALPTRFKTRGRGYGKYLHQKLLQRYAPKRVWKGPKRGFIFDIGDFDPRRMEALLDRYLATDRIRQTGLLDADEVSRLKADYLAGDRRLGALVMTILNFEMWREKFLG